MVEKKVYKKYKYQGISYPFRFSSKGGIETSTTTTRDVQHIRESVEQILRTSLGERVMLPEFGAGLKNLVFEPNNPVTMSLLEKTLLRDLIKWEPRIEVVDISISVESENLLVLVCIYKIPEIELEESIAVPYEF